MNLVVLALVVLPAWTTYSSFREGDLFGQWTGLTLVWVVLATVFLDNKLLPTLKNALITVSAVSAVLMYREGSGYMALLLGIVVVVLLLSLLRAPIGTGSAVGSRSHVASAGEGEKTDAAADAARGRPLRSVAIPAFSWFLWIGPVALIALQLYWLIASTQGLRDLLGQEEFRASQWGMLHLQFLCFIPAVACLAACKAAIDRGPRILLLRGFGDMTLSETVLKRLIPVLASLGRVVTVEDESLLDQRIHPWRAIVYPNTLVTTDEATWPATVANELSCADAAVFVVGPTWSPNLQRELDMSKRRLPGSRVIIIADAKRVAAPPLDWQGCQVYCEPKTRADRARLMLALLGVLD
ncbi:MAG: hypothetical protein NCW75_11415 [Phycisphaera sp.]|nr:MAG: hypothetical protein NCW75_11415 [Phycisphaera sp.]